MFEDEHLEMDYEDKNGNYEQEYPSWMEENNYDEEDNEDDPDMYPKDIERDQLDYEHNQPLMY